MDKEQTNSVMKNFDLEQKSDKKTLFSLQIYRGIAAVLVLLFHSNEIIKGRYQVSPFNGLFFFGFSGVIIFFVLSGFILYHIHAKDINQPQRFFNFVKKRFFRVYPTYWIILLMYSGFLFFSNLLVTKDFINNIFLLQLPEHLIILTSWSLYYEIFFYILFSLLILNRALGSAIIISWAVGVVLKGIFNIGHEALNYHLFHKYNILFVIGLIVAFIISKLAGQFQKTRWPIVASIMGMVAFSIMAIYCDSINWVRAGDPNAGAWWDNWPITLGFGLASALLMMAVTSKRLEEFFRKRKVLKYLGDASYSIYLVHLPIEIHLVPYLQAHLLLNLDPQLMVNIIFLLTSLLALLAGCIFYEIVEFRLLRYFRKHFFRQTA